MIPCKQEGAIATISATMEHLSNEMKEVKADMKEMRVESRNDRDAIDKKVSAMPAALVAAFKEYGDSTYLTKLEHKEYSVKMNFLWVLLMGVISAAAVSFFVNR